MSQSGLEHPKQRQRFLNPLLYALFQYPSPSSRVKEVRHTFSKSNGYTIIVPDTEVLEWSIDRDSALPFRDLCLQDDFLLSHVINTPTTLRSHERSRYFGTLNGKTVIVKDGSVFTLKGFKVFGRAHIKREYIFNPGQDYLPLDCQFVVYEVDNPLMGIPIPSKEVSPTLPKFDLVYSFREHKSKSSNLKSSASGLMSSFSSNSRVETKGSPPLSYSSGSGTEDPLTKDSYERELQRGLDLEKLFSKYPLLHRHVFSSLLALIESFDCSNASTEEDVYNCFDKTVESAFDIFQSGDPTSVNALASDFDLTGQDIADLIHRFIEKNLHEQLFSTLVFIRKNSDSELYKELQNLKNIDIGQVGLPFKSHQAFFRTERSVWAAIEQMKKLPKAKNADKKVHILLDVVRVLGGSASSTTRNCYANNTDGSSDAPDSSVSVKSTELKSTIEQSTIEKSTISNSVGSREEISIDHKDSNVTVVNADSLVSLLILVIVRSGLEYLDTELHYIRNFSSLDVESGQLGYTLLSFEGVVYHICHDSAKLAELSSRNNSLWSTISSHDYGEFVSFLQNLIETCPDWKSVLASRNNCGESFLVMTVQARRLHILRKVFEYQSIFPLSFIFYDISECGKSLLIYALETEEQDLIEEVLSKISEMSAELQRQYFDITDSWGRTVAHYFFHSFWLMKKIGKYVNWNAKDRNGQTPLFALCRCYDHPQYGELLKDGFDTWNSAAEISDEKLRTIDIMDHVDNKGNSLLHIVKDNNSVKRILLYDTDINWPNEKGLTPLMLFSKFSRIGALSLLTEDIRLDLNRREVRGFTALELAKDPSTTAYLEGKELKKIKYINS